MSNTQILKNLYVITLRELQKQNKFQEHAAYEVASEVA